MDYKYTDIRNPLVRDALEALINVESYAKVGRFGDAEPWEHIYHNAVQKIADACPESYADMMELSSQLARAMYHNSD